MNLPTLSPSCRSILALVLFTSLATVRPIRAADAGRRGFTVQDAIELSSIVNYSASEEGSPRAAPIVSPDRRSFLLITERGILASDRIESTIWLFDRQAAMDFVRHKPPARPVPRIVATLAATSNMAVISDVRWLGDSARVSFLGKNGGPNQQLFIADVKTGSLTSITRNDVFVSAYDIRGGTIAYTTIIPATHAAAPKDELVVVSPKSLAALLYPEPLGLEDAEWDSLSGYATGAARAAPWQRSAARLQLARQAAAAIPFVLVSLPFPRHLAG
jgi:hypothetical protein